MSIVKIKDKSFKTSIPEAEILKKVQVVADRINQDRIHKRKHLDLERHMPGLRLDLQH